MLGVTGLSDDDHFHFGKVSSHIRVTLIFLVYAPSFLLLTWKHQRHYFEKAIKNERGDMAAYAWHLRNN